MPVHNTLLKRSLLPLLGLEIVHCYCASFSGMSVGTRYAARRMAFVASNAHMPIKALKTRHSIARGSFFSAFRPDPFGSRSLHERPMNAAWPSGSPSWISQKTALKCRSMSMDSFSQVSDNICYHQAWKDCEKQPPDTVTCTCPASRILNGDNLDDIKVIPSHGHMD
jgi:hypothetical protein